MMGPRAARRRLATACLAMALGVCNGAPARAQPTAGAAELLDAEGTALMQDHRYAEACPKLAQSDRLHPGTGVLLRLGLCYQLSGKTASAWTTFHEAAGRARRAGDDPLSQLASRRAGALEPRLARVTLRLAPGADPQQVEVRLDGVVLDRSALGTPLPMDAGTHALVASTAGRPPFQRTLVVADGDAPATVLIDLGRAPGGSAPVGARPDAAARRRATQRTLALVAGGVGVAGIAVGSVFGLSAISNWNRALSECTSRTSGCSQDALSRQSVVKSDAFWSTTGFTVGAIGLVGAAVLWWTAPSLTVEAHGFSVGVTGRF